MELLSIFITQSKGEYEISIIKLILHTNAY